MGGGRFTAEDKSLSSREDGAVGWVLVLPAEFNPARLGSSFNSMTVADGNGLDEDCLAGMEAVGVAEGDPPGRSDEELSIMRRGLLRGESANGALLLTEVELSPFSLSAAKTDARKRRI
jgi:hypothetical protein